MKPSGKFFRACIIELTLLLPAASVTAQTHKIDSLKAIIQKTTDNSARLDAILALCNERTSLNPDTLQYYSLAARKMAIKLKDATRQAAAEYYTAFYYSKSGRADTALTITDDQLKKIMYDNSGKELYGKLSILKASILVLRLNRQKEGFDFLYKLLGDAEQQNDTITQAAALITIGTNYMIIGQYEESKSWYQKALKRLPAPVTDKYIETYAQITGNIGIDFLHLYQLSGKKPEIDSAEYYVSRAADIGVRLQNLFMESHFTGVKGEILSYQKRNKEAEEYMMRGLALRKLIGDPLYVASDMSILSSFYSNTGQPVKGISLSIEGIEYCKKNNITSTMLIFMYNSLAENYKAAGDYKNYGETMKRLVSVKDSVYKVNSAKELMEMQTKYEVEKKENTIIRQKYDLSRKNYFIYGIAGLLAATVLFGYVFFRNRRRTQVLKLQQLEAEQKQKTTQAVMQAEEEERKRIAGDLHDSVAQKMVVAKMNLASLGNKINGLNEQEQKIFNSINALLEESTAEVRNLSHSMMPQAFAHSGLTDAIKDFLDKIHDSRLQVHFSAEGSFENIPENKALMIYRIIQEAVQNVLKHAEASKLDVAMMAENDELDITIEDNGTGFDTRAMPAGSAGMKNIHTRTAYLGGKLDINSKPGRGTVMAFYIPAISNRTIE